MRFDISHAVFSTLVIAHKLPVTFVLVVRSKGFNLG